MEKPRLFMSSLKSENAQDSEQQFGGNCKMKKAPLSIRTRVHFLMASNLTHVVKARS